MSARASGAGENEADARLRPANGRPLAVFERHFTIAQAARALGTGTTTVRRLIREGRIVHQRVSTRRIVIPESALRAYLESVTQGRQHG